MLAPESDQNAPMSDHNPIGNAHAVSSEEGFHEDQPDILPPLSDFSTLFEGEDNDDPETPEMESALRRPPCKTCTKSHIESRNTLKNLPPHPQYTVAAKSEQETLAIIVGPVPARRKMFYIDKAYIESIVSKKSRRFISINRRIQDHFGLQYRCSAVWMLFDTEPGTFELIWNRLSTNEVDMALAEPPEEFSDISSFPVFAPLRVWCLLEKFNPSYGVGKWKLDLLWLNYQYFVGKLDDQAEGSTSTFSTDILSADLWISEIQYVLKRKGPDSMVYQFMAAVAAEPEYRSADIPDHIDKWFKSTQEWAIFFGHRRGLERLYRSVGDKQQRLSSLFVQVLMKKIVSTP
ncbi:hypothetical protein DM02DRAFT_732076 [Periconia macrospinosa]|uniref:Uncharacterized protein n=1 Tax=Periconia macrospinosa TaxID=97972 RepID=A0A2V1DC06_9PLEO|nr:hypothetical protein DM02DRAFT_732076 [Periconia macrospinosa]